MKTTPHPLHPSAPDISVLTYQPEHKAVFAALNTEWITTYFRLEPHDIEVLSDPEGTVIAPGGQIFVGCHKGEPLGVIALCKLPEGPYDYELAKLAVSPRAQGLGLGEVLCQAAIAEARARGARSILIECNTRLHAALHIYHKLGFQDLPTPQSSYERVDIQLVLQL